VPSWGDAERRRLVRLCTALTGDRQVAEDLAQETLLEGWRNAHKLHDPSGSDRWLAAIARHVCRRWARRQGRDLAALVPLEAGGDPPGTLDLDVELERSELAELLDRALGLLPLETRDVLVRRYVHDSPHAEIGAALRLSEDAVSMRLSRGKVLLRRLLASELRDEAAGYALVGDDGWRETRVWCSSCGLRTLVIRREPGATVLRCPGCSPAASRPGSRLPLSNPFFARLVGGLARPSAIAERAADWSWRYFSGGDAAEAGCTRCGRAVRLRRFARDADGCERLGLYAACDSCGEEVSASLVGIALGVPEVRRLRRQHRRIHGVPGRGADVGSTAAVVVRHEALSGSAGVDVLFARKTLRLLDVRVG
jgi:RNA polymerase sigma-70 factor (ECF subfamily)